jgi:carboxylesterase type B
MLQLFKMFPFDPMPEKEVTFSRKFIKLIIDFGKEGKPPSYLPDWKKLDLENPNYLVIDEDFKVKQGLPDKERLDFWRRQLDPVYWNYVLEGHTLHHEEL